MAKILIADDSITARSLFKRALANSHHEVVAEVENGEGAVLGYIKFKPDVVAMDLDMPGIGGLEASRRIVSSHPDANIMLVTSHEQNDLENISRQYGFKYVINKPVSQDAVLSMLKRIENEIGSRKTAKSPDGVKEKSGADTKAPSTSKIPESTNRTPEIIDKPLQNDREVPTGTNEAKTVKEAEHKDYFGMEGNQDSELYKNQMVVLNHYSRLSYFKGIIDDIGANFLELKIETGVVISNFFENDPIVVSYKNENSYNVCGYRIISMDNRLKKIKVEYIFSQNIPQESPADILPVSLSVDGKVNISGMKFSALIRGVSINNMLIASKTEFKTGHELEFYMPFFDNVSNIRAAIIDKFKDNDMFEYNISIYNGMENTKKTIKWFINALNEQHIRDITEMMDKYRES